MKKMVHGKEDLGTPSYVFGIVSIVLAFFTPLAGLIFGVIGTILSKGSNAAIAKRGKKLSKIGIVISVVVLVVTIIVAVVAGKSAGAENLFN